MLRNIYAYSEKPLQHALGKVPVLNCINFQTKNLIFNNLVYEVCSNIQYNHLQLNHNSQYLLSHIFFDKVNN